MKCYNCQCNLIIEVSKDDNIDANKIATKYKDYDLCSVCKENLINFGFLGDIDNPVLNYEPEKVKLNLKKLKKKK